MLPLSSLKKPQMIFLLTGYSVTQYFLHIRLLKCQGIHTDFVKMCKVVFRRHAHTYLHIVNHQRHPQYRVERVS